MLPPCGEMVKLLTVRTKSLHFHSSAVISVSNKVLLHHLKFSILLLKLSQILTLLSRKKMTHGQNSPSRKKKKKKTQDRVNRKRSKVNKWMAGAEAFLKKVGFKENSPCSQWNVGLFLFLMGVSVRRVGNYGNWVSEVHLTGSRFSQINLRFLSFPTVGLLTFIQRF